MLFKPGVQPAPLSHNSDIICGNLPIAGGVTGMGVWRLRAWNIRFILCAALLLQGCAANSERMPVQEASEAQRLVFGAPQAVRTQFASQIGTCWFAGSGPLKSDYTFAMPEAEEPGEPSLIRIFRLEPERAEVFQVQFYPHNDNTVVATRNVDLPDDLAEDLETSVELWLLEPSQCRISEDAVAGETPWDPSLQRADAGEDELQLPSLDDAQTAQDEQDVDMHQAELRARGAIE